MPEVIKAVVKLVAATFVPGLELRFSIPLGLFASSVSENLSLPLVVLICVLANVVVGVAVFELMRPVEKFFRKWGWFERRVWPVLERKREKLRPSVEKYGIWGVAVFIGIPLPGTGAYTGAVGAYLLNLDRRKFWISNLAGVLMAAAAVTLICILVKEGVVADDSFIRRLFIKDVTP